MHFFFLTSQIVRYWVGGVFPNSHGVERAAVGGETPVGAVFHTAWEIIGLGFVAIVTKGIGIFAEEGTIAFSERHAVSTYPATVFLILRFCSIITNVFHKTCGWLLLFTVSWALSGAVRFDKGGLLDINKKPADDTVQVRAITAVFCSYFGFAGIVILDKMPAIQASGRFKRGVLQSLSMMVGFAWRRLYGHCIDHISQYIGNAVIDNDSSDGELVLEICIGIPIAAVVLPALNMYITPNVVLAEQQLAQQHEEHQPDHESQSADAISAKASLRKSLRSSRYSVRGIELTDRPSPMGQVCTGQLAFPKAELTIEIRDTE